MQRSLYNCSPYLPWQSEFYKLTIISTSIHLHEVNICRRFQFALNKIIHGKEEKGTIKRRRRHGPRRTNPQRIDASHNFDWNDVATLLPRHGYNATPSLMHISCFELNQSKLHTNKRYINLRRHISLPPPHTGGGCYTSNLSSTVTPDRKVRDSHYITIYKKTPQTK